MLAMIVAKASNNVIGRDNKLIWHLPNDLRHFKELTTGHTIIMGRKTLESLPCKLPNREHWVLTKQTGYVPPFEGVKVFTSLESVLAAIQPAETVFCIGGAEIYRACMPYADKLYVTELETAFEGDATFPLIDDSFAPVEVQVGQVDEKNQWKHRFVIYERTR